MKRIGVLKSDFAEVVEYIDGCRDLQKLKELAEAIRARVRALAAEVEQTLDQAHGSA